MSKSPALGIDLSLPEDLQTIDATQLGKLIGRSTKSIKNDLSRRPESLPPRFFVPGMKRQQYMWRVVDVRAWMEALAQVQAEQRLREREFARRLGVPHAPGSFALANTDIGRAATRKAKE